MPTTSETFVCIYLWVAPSILHDGCMCIPLLWLLFIDFRCWKNCARIKEQANFLPEVIVNFSLISSRCNLRSKKANRSGGRGMYLLSLGVLSFCHRFWYSECCSPMLILPVAAISMGIGNRWRTSCRCHIGMSVCWIPCKAHYNYWRKMTSGSTPKKRQWRGKAIEDKCKKKKSMKCNKWQWCRHSHNFDKLYYDSCDWTEPDFSQWKIFNLLFP